MGILAKEKLVRNQIKTALSGQGFLSAVAVLASGAMFGQAILLLASPILTRLYSPGDFGQFALVVSFLGISSIFVTLSYESSIVAARDEEDAAKLTILAMALPLITSVLPLSILYVLIGAKSAGFGALPGWILFLAWPGLLVTAMFAALRAWLIRTNSFSLLSKISITQNIIRAVFQIGFGIANAGWIGLVIGDLFGRSGGVVVMAQQTLALFRTRLGSLRLTELQKTATQYKRFPLYVLPSSLIDTLTLVLPLPVISHLYGPTMAGYYALVQRVIAVPITMIGASVADAFYNRVGSQAREDPAKMEPFFLRTATMLATLGVLPALILFAFGPLLFGWIFGNEWVVAGSMASAMSFWALAQFVVSPLTRIVFVLGAQRLKLVYDLLSLVLVIGALLGGYALQLSAIGTIALLSLLNVVAYIVYFLLLLYAIRHAELGIHD